MGEYIDLISINIVLEASSIAVVFPGSGGKALRCSYHVGDTFSYLPRSKEEYIAACLVECNRLEMFTIQFQRNAHGVCGFVWLYDSEEEPGYFRRKDV